MRRVSVFLASLLAALGICLHAQNPDDIQVSLRLLKTPAEYQRGESIRFEFALSSSTEQKYFASTGLQAGVTPIVFNIDPVAGTVDVLARERNGMFMGSILSSSDYLGTEPLKTSGDLTDWVRFEKPGRYRVDVLTRQVSRVKAVGQGIGKEELALHSNVVEFEILPIDPAWESQELQSLFREIDQPPGADGRNSTEHRFGLLDAPGAIHQIASRYLATQDGPDAAMFARVLSVSSELEIIIPMLEAALRDSPALPPSSLAELMADLKTRKALGVLPAYPTEPGERGAYETALRKRRKLHDEYLSQATEALMAGMHGRTTSERIEIIYQAWSIAEAEHAADDQPSRSLTDLREEALGLAAKLDRSQRHVLLAVLWSQMPHARLLPLVESLGVAESEYWCQDWPNECAAAIVADVQKPNSNLPCNTILLIPEAERPDMDSLLQERLTNAKQMEGDVSGVQTAALLLRTGSRNLQGLVDSALEEQSRRPANCQTRGLLLGYLFRVAPDVAQRRLAGALGDEHGRCGSELFSAMIQASHSDRALSVAMNALNSSNLETAAEAALFLGAKGSASTKDALYQRLLRLRAQWQDRSAEMNAAFLPTDVWSRIGNLEQCLVSALLHSRSWQITESDRKSLRDGCLSEQSRLIVDGKLSLGI